MESLYTVDSTKPFEQLKADLEKACQQNKFGVLNMHDLRGKMREKGVDFQKEVYVFDVCNPHQAKKVLDAELNISSMLPCRISVYRTERGMRLVTVRPTLMLGMFGAKGLEPVAKEVEQTLIAIMNQAAR